MSALPQEIGEFGLKFFGMMTAAVSHDIKNVLAIINENAGLIKDLIRLAEKRPPLDVNRIETLADRCGQQVARADAIIRNLNRFSHSIDDPIKQVDISEMADLTVSLSARFARLRGIIVELSPKPPAIFVTTNPFFLNQLLWLCLDYAMDTVDADKKITVEIHPRGSCLHVYFSGLCDVAEKSQVLLFGDQGKKIRDYLGAELILDENRRAIGLMLPIETKHEQTIATK